MHTFGSKKQDKRGVAITNVADMFINLFSGQFVMKLLGQVDICFSLVLLFLKLYTIIIKMMRVKHAN